MMNLKKKWLKRTGIVLLVIGLIMTPLILIDRMFPFLFVTRIRNTIEITCDEDFAKYDFPGEGTEEDPIIISDLVIGTDNFRIAKAYRLVTIYGTSYHIIIENCHFIGGYSALDIYSIGGSLTIRNNIFTGAEHYSGLDEQFFTISIELENLDNVYIHDNTFNGRTEQYLMIRDINNTIIENNTMSSTDRRSGIEIAGCSNITIESNSIQGYLYTCASAYIYIISNSIYEGDGYFYGLTIDGVIYFEIIGNNLSKIPWYAVSISLYSSNGTIYHNTFLDNYLGSFSQALDDGYNCTWYSLSLLSGNYWSNIGVNTTYEIAGTAGSIDLYPLANPL